LSLDDAAEVLKRLESTIGELAAETRTDALLTTGLPSRH
jgi:hypothetical protein